MAQFIIITYYGNLLYEIFKETRIQLIKYKKSKKLFK